MERAIGFVSVVTLSLLLTVRLVGAENIALGVVTKPGAGQNICAEKFKDLVEGASGHRVQIFHSGTVGTEREILLKIQSNRLQMDIVTSAPFDEFVPEVSVIDYPFLFETYRRQIASSTARWAWNC